MYWADSSSLEYTRKIVIVFVRQRWVNLIWLEIDAGREACWKDRPLPQDLQGGNERSSSQNWWPISCACAACVEMRLTIITGEQLDVNLVVVLSGFLENWMNE